MINKYAEIKDRLALYNACKGILRVKQAAAPLRNSYLTLTPDLEEIDMDKVLSSRRQYPRTASTRMAASRLMAGLGLGSTLDLRRQYPRGLSYTDNNSPNTTTTTKVTPSMPGPTQYVSDRTNNTGNNKSGLSDLAKRSILRSGAFGAAVGGTL